MSSLSAATTFAAGPEPGSPGDAGEEGRERGEGCGRRLLGQIMPAVERRAGHVAGPVAPDAEDVIPAPDLALRAPQREKRAGDLAPRNPVGLVEGEVEGRPGPV